MACIGQHASLPGKRLGDGLDAMMSHMTDTDSTPWMYSDFEMYKSFKHSSTLFKYQRWPGLKKDKTLAK